MRLMFKWNALTRFDFVLISSQQKVVIFYFEII